MQNRKSETFVFLNTLTRKQNNSIFRNPSAAQTSISTRHYQWFTSWICKRVLTRPLKQDYPWDETKFIALEMFCHDDGWKKEAREDKATWVNRWGWNERCVIWLILIVFSTLLFTWFESAIYCETMLPASRKLVCHKTLTIHSETFFVLLPIVFCWMELATSM